MPPLLDIEELGKRGKGNIEQEIQHEDINKTERIEITLKEIET